MSLRRTPFFKAHQQSGARLIDFGGWEMPVQYTGIKEEHLAVRASVGLFDVSHMGELRVKGPNALAALEHLVSNRVTGLPVGQSVYAVLMNEQGGAVDDLFIYRLADEDYLVCVNAANREKDLAWFQSHNPHGAEIVDECDVWAQVAIQGRNGHAVTQALTSADLSGAARGSIVAGDFAGVQGCLLARTGYTGEDGYEVFIPADQAGPTWDRILAAGAAHDIVPVGLGARDTLRLEVRNALYGQELTDDTSPLEAGLGWITKLNKGPFIGRDVLQAQKRDGVARKLIGLVVENRIARPHCPILNADGEPIGEVTSGTRSPSLGTNIALGYVQAGGGNARPGNTLTVDVRGRTASATVVKGPFYTRDY
ncbi:MAG: glycine cleavage system aminomethyltransferase GcvT [Alphaproteobacteria bacterium]|nr:glycine cleavage system aminomethyltransferase GcvT [Alphaproteobacteria bacterium]